jgi:hypothetical protein
MLCRPSFVHLSNCVRGRSSGNYLSNSGPEMGAFQHHRWFHSSDRLDVPSFTIRGLTRPKANFCSRVPALPSNCLCHWLDLRNDTTLKRGHFGSIKENSLPGLASNCVCFRSCLRGCVPHSKLDSFSKRGSLPTALCTQLRIITPPFTSLSRCLAFLGRQNLLHRRRYSLVSPMGSVYRYLCVCCLGCHFACKCSACSTRSR